MYIFHSKECVKRQKIVHTYGDEELLDTEELQEQLEEQIKAGTVASCIPNIEEGSLPPKDVELVIGGKKCKCGSTTHQHTSHSDCPLRKGTEPTELEEQMQTGIATNHISKKCKCGSFTHQRTSHKDCPLRKQK